MNSAATPYPPKRKRSGSVDVTPTTRLKSNSVYFQGQFRATALWNDIQSYFVNECPRKRHRRQLTYIDDSFTGKEAVNFLMQAIPERFLNGRIVSRENCAALLQKFMEKNIFVRSRGGMAVNEKFKDNATLYSFVSSKIPKLISESNFVKSPRADSALNEQLSPIASLNANLIISAGWDRRMSMSHGNLSWTGDGCVNSKSKESVKTQHAVSIHKPYPKEGVDENDTPSTSAEEWNRSGSNISKAEGAYEWLSFGKAGCSQVSTEVFMNTEHSRYNAVTRNGKDVLIETGSATFPAGVGGVISKIGTGLLDELNVYSIFKSCLLRRLQEVLGSDAALLVRWEINGCDVKWNCENIGTSGVVKSRDKYSDTFPPYLTKLIRYLEVFPFPYGSCSVITYQDQQEVKVFKTLCSNFSREPPLISGIEAKTLLDVIAHFHEKQLQCHSSSMLSHVDERLSQSRKNRCSGGASLTKCATVCATTATTMSSLSLRSVASDLPNAIRTNGLLDGTQIAFSSSALSDESLGSEASPPVSKLRLWDKKSCILDPSSFTHLGPEAYFGLPGLKSSPELVDRIKQICHSPEMNRANHAFEQQIWSPCYSSPALSPTAACLGKFTTTLKVGLSLVLLSISPARRRKLHHLIRFMNKFTANHCLQLDAHRTNREVVVECLSPCVAPIDDGSISTVQSMELVKFLMDNERELFSVDKKLLSDVAKATKVPETSNLHCLPTPSSVQYCEKHDTYIRQNSAADDNLTPLMEQLLHAPMKESERERKLKQFKKAHPDAHALRFSGESQNSKAKRSDGFLRRLFSR